MVTGMLHVSIDLLFQTERSMYKDVRAELKKYRRAVDLPKFVQQMEVDLYIIRTIIWMKVHEQARSRSRDHGTKVQEKKG